MKSPIPGHTTNGNRQQRDILQLLSELERAQLQLVMLVFGADQSAHAIVTAAEEVALNYASLAEVLHVPNPTILDERYPLLAAAAAAGDQVVVLSLDFQIKARLRGDRATDFDALDQAFIDATGGGE